MEEKNLWRIFEQFVGSKRYWEEGEAFEIAEELLTDNESITQQEIWIFLHKNAAWMAKQEGLILKKIKHKNRQKCHQKILDRLKANRT